ncbi:MAG TPA: hypothetical protein VFF52_11350, partial [Isosphaeraceae bacterium]|nr:hypothetical protein [Isosphaeraceae bacterium]
DAVLTASRTRPSPEPRGPGMPSSQGPIRSPRGPPLAGNLARLVRLTRSAASDYIRSAVKDMAPSSSQV